MPKALAVMLYLNLGAAQAQWTGIELELGNSDYDWEFGQATREAQVNKISLKIEEKTQSELRVGASVGYLDLRVVGDTAATSQKFDGQFLSLFLRLPLKLSDHLSVHGLLSHSYHSGDESDAGEASFDWSETNFRFALGLRNSRFRIEPYIGYSDIDGDLSGGGETEIFALDERRSKGLRFDYFVDDSGFIRIEFIDGAQSGGYLSFSRRY